MKWIGAYLGKLRGRKTRQAALEGFQRWDYWEAGFRSKADPRKRQAIQAAARKLEEKR
jgi:hypothetical protein